MHPVDSDCLRRFGLLRSLYPEDAVSVTFPVTNGGELTAKINTSAPFCGFEIKTGDASSADAVLTLSVYTYTASYQTTVAAEPVAKAEFRSVAAGEWVYLQTREMPAGEYLLVVTANSDGVTFEKTEGKPDSIEFYYAQTPISDGAFPIKIICKQEKTGELTAAQILTKPAAEANAPAAAE